MSLFTTHTDANKQQLQAPFTRVTKRLTVRLGIYLIWETDNTYTEKFKYVGIHRDSVNEIVGDLTSEHTENITNYVLLENGVIEGTTANTCVADITATPVGGLMWEIDVNVNKSWRSLETFTPQSQQGGG